METITITWNYEDVLSRAEERDIELTKEQACEILHNVDKYHDANEGVNWAVLDVHTDMYLSQE